MREGQVIKKIAANGFNSFLPAGQKAAVTAELVVRGSELGGVMAVSMNGGLAIMLVLIIAIVAAEYALHRFIQQGHTSTPTCKVSGRKGRWPRRPASMPIPVRSMPGGFFIGPERCRDTCRGRTHH